jgi:hypothetical protein
VPVSAILSSEERGKKMTRSKALATVFCLLAVFVFALPKATASDWNKQTRMTFSESVEVPGVAVPAGTYTFALLNSGSNSNIVQYPVLAVRSYAVPNLAVITAVITIRPTIRPKQRPVKEITLEQTYSLHFSAFLGMDILSRHSDESFVSQVWHLEESRHDYWTQHQE